MPNAEPAPLLICYDRSLGARHAIEQAASLFPGRSALILDVWTLPLEIAALGMGAAALAERGRPARHRDRGGGRGL